MTALARIPGLTREMRRARLLAARAFAAGYIPRRAILRGDWDTGDLVRRHLAAASPAKEG